MMQTDKTSTAKSNYLSKMFPGGKSKMPLLITLIPIFFLALSVRVGLIYLEPRITPYYGMMTPMGDAARNMVEGRGYVIDQAYVDEIIELISVNKKLFDIQDVPPPANEKFVPFSILPPGPSALMALTYKIFDDYRYIYIRVLQAIIDAFGCFIIYLLGKEMFNSKTGIIAALLYAVWLPIAYLATWPLHDALLPFFTLVITYFFIMGVKNSSIKYYALSGLICGVSCYFQPSTMFLPLFFGVGLLIYNFHKSGWWKQVIYAAKITAVMVAVMVLVMAPWIIRNTSLYGTFTMMRAGGEPWSGLWEASGEFGDSPDGAELSDTKALELAKKELGHDVDLLSPEFQQYYKVKFITQMMDHPVWYFSLPLRRLPRAIFNFSELGIFLHPSVSANYSAWLDYLYGLETRAGYDVAIGEVVKGLHDGSFWRMVVSHPYGALYLGLVWCFALIPPLAAIAVLIIKRKNWRNFILLVIVPAYFIVGHMLTMVASYKSIVPAQVVYIVFCAVAIYSIGQWLNTRASRPIITMPAKTI